MIILSFLIYCLLLTGFLRVLFLCQTDKHRRQHGKYIRLDKGHQQFQSVHKDIEQHRSYRQRTVQAVPILADMNIRHVSTSIAMCPASILAKRRIIKANGFVKIPKNSINGIMGTALSATRAHRARKYLSNMPWFRKY